MTDLDRYDWALSWLMAVAAAGALLLGAPLWAIVLIAVAGCSLVFIRHIDEFRPK
jgi:hypothetical protein